jgi:hypothetical protein
MCIKSVRLTSAGLSLLREPLIFWMQMRPRLSMIRAVRDFGPAVGAGIRRIMIYVWYSWCRSKFARWSIFCSYRRFWMSQSLAISVRFMEKVSLGSGASKHRRSVSRKTMTASKTSPDPVVLAQLNIVMPFVHYWMKIRICYRDGLLSFSKFTRPRWKMICMKVSCSEKSISSGFLISWMIIKSQKGFDSQPSPCRSSSQNRNASWQIHARDETWVYENNPQSWMWAGVGVARPTRARSLIGAKTMVIWASFSRSGIGNAALLPLKEMINCVFVIHKVLADFDKELGRHVRWNVRGTLSVNLTSSSASLPQRQGAYSSMKCHSEDISKMHSFRVYLCCQLQSLDRCRRQWQQRWSNPGDESETRGNNRIVVRYHSHSNSPTTTGSGKHSRYFQCHDKKRQWFLDVEKTVNLLKGEHSEGIGLLETTGKMSSQKM